MPWSRHCKHKVKAWPPPVAATVTYAHRMVARVMLVEDDAGIAGSLVQVLVQHGYAVDHQSRGADAIAAAELVEPDVVLLDLGLPDMDGIEVCRALRRSHPAIAIMMLTARNAEIDVVLGLDAGADDYIAKPFRLAELMARLRTHERRRDLARPGLIKAGEVGIDRASRRATVNDVEMQLSPKEFDLLTILAAECGRVLTREHIIEAVWDEHWYKSTKTLDMHVVALRRKLAAGGAKATRITTLRGIGYRLDVE
jgi:DNA-binding response OmpR family regulator